MAIEFCGNGASPVFNFDSKEEENAFEYYLQQTGDLTQAYSLFYQKYRVSYNEYLKDRIGTKIIEGFTPSQQRQTVNLMKYFFVEYMNTSDGKINGVPNVNKLKGTVKVLFTGRPEQGVESPLKKLHKNSQYRLDMIDKVIDNFDLFWDMAVASLKDSGIIVQRDGTVTSIAGPDLVRRNWDDLASIQIDPKTTSSVKVKLVLSFIPKVEYDRNNEGEIRKDDQGNRKIKKSTNYLGYPDYMSLDQAYDTIAEVLSNYIPPENVDNKFEALMEELERRSGKNPQLKAIANHIRNKISNTQFQSDFVNALQKHYGNESLVMFQPNGRGGYSMRVVESNRTSQEETIKSQWYENQKRLPIVRQDKDGDLMINKDEIRKIKKEYVDFVESYDGSFRDDDFIEYVENLLSRLGIEVPITALEEARDNPRTINTTGNWRRNFNTNNGGPYKDGLMGIIFNTFLSGEGDPIEQELEEYGKLGLNNPVYGQDTQGVIDKLAKLTAKHTPKIYSPSYTNVKGNLIYAIQDHTSISKEVIKLLQNPESALDNADAYERSSLIRQELASGLNRGNIENVFSLDYVDGLKRQGRSSGTRYPDMSTTEKELVRLSFFQKQKDRSKFLAPTLSDKSRDYIITLPEFYEFYTNEGRWITSGEKINDDGTLDLSLYGPEISALYQAAESEIKRILNIQDLESKNINHPLGSAYQEGSKIFFLFQELNSENTPDIWTKDGNLKNPDDNDAVKDSIRRALRETLIKKVNETKNQWRKTGIVSDKMNDWLMDREYLKRIPYRMSDTNKKLTYAALDYALSYRVFHSNITQIVNGDPAQHIKMRATKEETIKETMVNLQKRLALQIAPSHSGNWGTDTGKNRVNMITLQDRITGSKEVETYKKWFKEQGLSEELAVKFFGDPRDNDIANGIETTDAQEYTTLEEHAFMALSHGKINQGTYNKIRDKLEEVRNNDDPNNYYTLRSFLTEEEYRNLLFLPHKPIYGGKKYYQELDTSIWLYRKTSSFPLIPEMVRGTGLDKLRIAMENEGVDRAGYQTADKLGAINPINIFKDDNTKTIISASQIQQMMVPLSEDIENGTIQDRSRNDLGLQFELPRGKKKSVKIGSQLNKLLNQGIRDKTIIVNGEEKTGYQVEQMKQDLRKKMFELGRDELLDEINATLTPTKRDNEYKIEYENKEALQELLIKEARARDWDQAAIDSLELDEKGDFILPLSFTPNTRTIESLLVSIINDRVIEQETYGAGFVQTSGTGWNNIANNGEVYVTEKYDPEMGLRHIHEDENGNVQPAQVLVPWNFKDSSGNLLDPRDYTKKTEDGRRVIDNEKLDPELRKVIGFRIPTQGANSALPIEIVGFLPPTIDKLMVVTDETVAQMGSDFDVDKLFGYLQEYTLDNDSKIKKSKKGDSGFDELKQVKQDYVDLHWDILMNKDTISRVLQPLDMPELSNEADFIEDLRPTEEEYDWLSPHQQVIDHNNQQAGKKLIGIFSNFSVFSAMLEDYPLEMTGRIKTENGSVEVPRVIRVEDVDGNMVNLNTAGGNITVDLRDGKKGLIADIIKMAQNAAVDNAKELVLGKLNLTTNTANVFATMTILNNGSKGVALEQSARFMAQPIIKKLDEEIKKLSSQTNEEYIPGDTTRVAINNISEEIKKAHGKEILKKTSNGYTETQDRIIEATIPNKDYLKNAIKRPLEDIYVDEQFAIKQLNILNAYAGLYRISRSLDGVQTVVNFGDRKGPGKSLLHAKNKVQELRNLVSNNMFRDGRRLLYTEKNNPTEWGSAAENSFVLADNLFSDLFEYNSNIFNDIIGRINEIREDGVTSDEALSIFRELRSFVFSSGDMFGNIEGERTNLLFGENNIASRVFELQEELGNTNHFIQRLRPIQPEGEEDPAKVEFSADKGDQLDEMKITHDFVSMLISSDPKIRNVAEDLVKYSYIVGGGTLGPRTFHNYIPIGYLLSKGLKDTVNNFDFENTGQIHKRFLEQYYQHNAREATNIGDDQVNKIKINNGVFDPKDIYKKAIEDGKDIPLWVSFYDTDKKDWRIFKNISDKYVEIDRLGGVGIKEYNANKTKTFNSSVIPSNRSTANARFENEGEPKEVNRNQKTLSEFASNRRSISAEEYVGSVLDNIEDPYTQEMMKFVQDQDMDFKVTFYTDEEFKSEYNIKGEGTYDSSKPKDLIINRNVAEKGDNYLARTVLHEWIHRQTRGIRGSDSFTEEQTKLLKKINRLMKTAVKTNRPSDKLMNAITDSDGKIMFDEFIAYGVANKAGQEWLAETKIDNKSALRQILNSIKRLMLTLAESLGYDIDVNSSLAHTIDATLNLIQETNKVRENVNDNPKSKDSNEAKEENKKLTPKEKLKMLRDAKNLKHQVSLRDKDSLGDTVGEARAKLKTQRQKELFDKYRNRFQTKCN